MLPNIQYKQQQDQGTLFCFLLVDCVRQGIETPIMSNNSWKKICKYVYNNKITIM